MAKRASGTRGSPSQASPRFSGITGRRRLIECLRSQTLVSNDRALARALQKSGELCEFERDAVLIRQGDPDNDILLIIHGEVSILVNNRAVAKRGAGTHVGEMALVDHLATRSGSAIALEPTVALRVPEHKFSRIASQYPDLWRRVAVQIANRLRERNRFLPQPHSESVLFIGSSSEGLDIVDAVHAIMVRRKIVPRPWTEGVFEASSTTIESLVMLTREADFAALILTADDVTVSRGRKKPSPRDNVVFELGLLMGALGRERVFILKPKNVDIRIPTDLLGVTWLEYRKGGPDTLREKLRTPCTAILRRVAALGPK
jgi:CRP/FNR family transcriptional regulator, cyclic AMP receptor protein